LNKKTTAGCYLDTYYLYILYNITTTTKYICIYYKNQTVLQNIIICTVFITSIIICGRRKYKKNSSGDRDEWRRLGVKIITFQRYFSKQTVCILLYFYIFLVTVGFIRRTAHVFSITSTHTHNTYMNVHFYFFTIYTHITFSELHGAHEIY